MKLFSLLLATAAILPITDVAADEKWSRIISEGYTNPQEALSANSLAPSNRNSGLSDENQFDEVWVSDVDTVLFNDSDDDGYFAGFSVALDVDVTQGYAHVFANIYLQSSGAAPELFHSTNIFTIYAQDSFDRYRVEVDLTDNLRAGDYDLIIDVVNAYSSQLEDTVSHRTHSNLSRLPLESQDNQHNQNVNDPYYDPYYDSNVVTTFTVGTSSSNGVNSSFGLTASVTEFRGGAGWTTLLILAAAGAFRANRRA